MYKTILTKNQLDLLPLIKKLSKDYYLVGGTAIALHIGHRRSIDFDLFTHKRIKIRQEITYKLFH
ncbi:MAG: nucleotidyl transferase AbiEii/AbiGii toxin family protein [Candidatus Magnetomorum sp.]|nr:nucleotidyl transferase AbiEii/AbiGii toxin family protein [Candidatus Magnetomorum sp.]